jgi:GT2 family glycosyltransferase
VSVLIGYIHTDKVSYSFMDSLLRTVKDQREFVETYGVRSGPMTIPAGRNALVEQFLASNYDFLWMVDTDMGWGTGALNALMRTAREKAGANATVPVVGAYTIGEFGGPPDGMGGFDRRHAPVMYRMKQGKLELLGDDEYDDGDVVPVDATGAACLMIHRSAVRDWSGWFDTTKNMGEDIAFCMRLRQLGVPLYVHTGVKTSHHKSVFLKEPSRDQA